MEMSMGYLFERKSISYNSKKHDIFELIDVVTGIRFVNKYDKELYSIASGAMAGRAVCMDIDELSDGENYLVKEVDLSKAVTFNNNKVDFPQIREKYLTGGLNYFIVKHGALEPIRDEKLISYLESTKKKAAFDEEAFASETDISKMYNSIKKTVVSQDEQIMQILTALFKNQKVINSDFDNDLVAKLKENVLIYGATGTGKTEIVKRFRNYTIFLL